MAQFPFNNQLGRCCFWVCECVRYFPFVAFLRPVLLYCLGSLSFLVFLGWVVSRTFCRLNLKDEMEDQGLLVDGQRLCG